MPCPVRRLRTDRIGSELLRLVRLVRLVVLLRLLPGHHVILFSMI